MGSRRKPYESARDRVARHMRARRAALELSQEKLAELCELHRTYIGSMARPKACNAASMRPEHSSRNCDLTGKCRTTLSRTRCTCSATTRRRVLRAGWGCQAPSASCRTGSSCPIQRPPENVELDGRGVARGHRRRESAARGHPVAGPGIHVDQAVSAVHPAALSGKGIGAKQIHCRPARGNQRLDL